MNKKERKTDKLFMKDLLVKSRKPNLWLWGFGLVVVSIILSAVIFCSVYALDRKNEFGIFPSVDGNNIPLSIEIVHSPVVSLEDAKIGIPVEVHLHGMNGSVEEVTLNVEDPQPQTKTGKTNDTGVANFTITADQEGEVRMTARCAGESAESVFIVKDYSRYMQPAQLPEEKDIVTVELIYPQLLYPNVKNQNSVKIKLAARKNNEAWKNETFNITVNPGQRDPSEVTTDNDGFAYFNVSAIDQEIEYPSNIEITISDSSGRIVKESFLTVGGELVSTNTPMPTMEPTATMTPEPTNIPEIDEQYSSFIKITEDNVFLQKENIASGGIIDLPKDLELASSNETTTAAGIDYIKVRISCWVSEGNIIGEGLNANNIVSATAYYYKPSVGNQGGLQGAFIDGAKDYPIMIDQNQSEHTDKTKHVFIVGYVNASQTAPVE